MDLPIYKIDISDNDFEKEEVDYIALVDSPAIKSNFLKFNSQPQTFAIQSEEERIVTGLAMVADMPIFRRDKEMGEYYVFFDAPVIKQIAQRFFRKGYNFNLNLMHDAELKTENVYVFESWIVDRAKGKVPMDQFKDVADGSWLISVKVDNDAVWQAIKDGVLQGFSVEGLFKLGRIKMSKTPDEILIEKLKELLQDFPA